MRRLPLIAIAFLFIGVSVNASTIVTVTCTVADQSVTQSGPNSASCDVITSPRPGEAAANGTVSVGSLYGFTGTRSIQCCPVATSVVRHAECRLSRALRARLTFSRMSLALAVQMNGLGVRL
jgi:hypothetical protein